MTSQRGPLPVPQAVFTKRTARSAGAIMLIFAGLASSSAKYADGALTATAPAQKEMPSLVPNPAEVMAMMARELDKKPDDGVLVLDTIKITQGEMADVIRTMPVAMASLGFAEVSRRALEVLVNQKAMVINAIKLGLDKDPAVIRRTNALRDRALADAWLSRLGNAAITDQALHAKYDSEIAGKPGPYQVRARLILVPKEDEARAIIEKAQAGADFADLARSYSKDGSASKGGDLGYATQDALSPDIGAVAFALQLGQVTAFPMRSALGYFILRVEGRQQRGTPTFEEARSQLEAGLRADAVRDAIENVTAHIKMAPGSKTNEPAKQ